MNSIETILSKVLLDSVISHDEFNLVINEEQSHFKLKENIRVKDNQLRDIERDRLIEEGKRDEDRMRDKVYNLRLTYKAKV